MGLIRKGIAVGIGKFVFDQLRKPENQARIRQLVASKTARPGRRP
jgi:hypothetical protein